MAKSSSAVDQLLGRAIKASSVSQAKPGKRKAAGKAKQSSLINKLAGRY